MMDTSQAPQGLNQPQTELEQLSDSGIALRGTLENINGRLAELTNKLGGETPEKGSDGSKVQSMSGGILANLGNCARDNQQVAENIANIVTRLEGML